MPRKYLSSKRYINKKKKNLSQILSHPIIQNKKKCTEPIDFIATDENDAKNENLNEIEKNNYIGKCCFCGEICNPLSQSCGQCMRNGNFAKIKKN